MWGMGGDEGNWKKNNGFWEKMLQENTKNRMDTESKEHRFIWSNTAKGEYHF